MTIDLNGHTENKYFGTDGFRGEANVGLTSMHAYRIGRFLGWYFANPISGCNKQNYRPRIVIGKDTRRSSYMLEYSIVAGLTASGADAYMLHVTTTPSVTYVTRQDEFDCGVMITASHNPFYDNGIKIINRFGEKLDNATAALIEAYLDGNLDLLGVKKEDLPVAHRENLGGIIDYVAGRNRYIGYLISVAAHSYKNLRIGLDCANGAAWNIAKSIFEALGAQVYLTGASPDGLNINRDCGSTHIENLRSLVTEQHLDAGFAFDGDADRCIAVDEQGTIVDGDTMLFILATRLKQRGMLDQDTVVATVMSNTGVERALAKEGIRCIRTNVGDRFIYEAMQKGGYRLGGEQSGHIILRKYATTGDGLLTAIMIAEQMLDEKLPLSALAKPVVYLPQMEKNIPAADKSAVIQHPQVQETLQKIKDRLGDAGRILLRESGTEPMVRIMVEAETEELCQTTIDEMAETIHSVQKV
ncbi:MAG: phosphoglucosamine mutase [Clostridia bacterium]|nr:phosphoglucosamine mutase [Clostridia bacterium]